MVETPRLESQRSPAPGNLALRSDVPGFALQSFYSHAPRMKLVLEGLGFSGTVQTVDFAARVEFTRLVI